jgi:N-acetylglucosamine-6-phosphate deacetylase
VRFALTGARVFDGEALHEGLSVVVRDGRIEALARASEIGSGIERRNVSGLLAPGFIDVQVNGGGGVLFNTERSVAGIRAIGAAHRRFGTTGFLATFISDTPAHTAEAIAAAREALAVRAPGVIGIHLEGPFLNPARKGAHDGAMLRRAVAEDVKPIADAAASMPVLLTIAPECVPPEILARFADAGVILSAGHSEADLDSANAAFANGVCGVTHLFNAMPPLSARAPGLAGAALDADDVWCGIIADLQHVVPSMLRVAFMAKGAERLMLVTDAMPPTGTDMTSFDLSGRRITRSGGRLTTAEGTLAGADLDMASAVRNAVTTLGLPIEAALRMASLTPATFLRLARERGRIASGYRADLVLLDDDLRAAATWIEGVEEPAG